MDEFGFLRRTMSRFTPRVVTCVRVRENEHWPGQTCFHARTVWKFDHGICRSLLPSAGRPTNVSVSGSALHLESIMNTYLHSSPSLIIAAIKKNSRVYRFSFFFF